MRSRTALAVPAVLLIVAGALLFRDASSRQASQRAGAEALHAARESIPALLSYRPDTAEQELGTAARDRLTGRFLDDYTQLITTVVVPDARQKRITASATVPAAAVVSASTDHAVVLAYVDQNTTIGTEPPSQANTSVRVSMDKVDGRWLISGFDQI